MEYVKGNIGFQNGQYTMDGEVLLDCKDYIHNYSRVPLNPTGQRGIISLPELIQKNMEDHKKINENTDQAPYVNMFFLLDILMSSFFVHHGEPLKVAEIGADKGSLSTHIASLLHAFDPKAEFVCICNTIGNESGNEWLNRICQAEAPDGLSLVASDFFNTRLQDEYFNYVVINGTVTISEPMETIKEAARITSKDGSILCFCESQFLLDDMIQMLFPVRKEWRFDPERVLFLVKKEDIWQG